MNAPALTSLTPGTKYIDGWAGYSTLTGPYLRGEVGWKPLPFLTTYLGGQWTPKESKADAGFRVSW